MSQALDCLLRPHFLGMLISKLNNSKTKHCSTDDTLTQELWNEQNNVLKENMLENSIHQQFWIRTLVLWESIIPPHYKPLILSAQNFVFDELWSVFKSTANKTRTWPQQSTIHNNRTPDPFHTESVGIFFFMLSVLCYLFSAKICYTH